MSLANAINVNATILSATIDRFNQHASQEEDPEFGKGSTA